MNVSELQNRVMDAEHFLDDALDEGNENLIRYWMRELIEAEQALIGYMEAQEPDPDAWGMIRPEGM